MFEEIFSQFSDSTVYFVMGALGTLVFSIKALLLIVFGMDDGGDFDLDAGAGASDGLHIFSLLSIVSFMMGAGWMGLACRLEWGLGPVPSALASTGFGFSLMLGTSYAMYRMKKFDQPGHYDVQKCVGHTGRVYLAIPAQGALGGQVEINVDGRRSVMPAVTLGPAIASFAPVKVASVKDDQRTLVVEPA